MTSTSDPLSNCSTNAIILHDFGEIAYIVCTVSIPPQGHNALQPPSPENNLARLRVTQKQFQDASILAAIDPTSLQLFTFYKKVDVMNNQRAILEKFGMILKANSFTIAYKAAARAPELFKPENARLYRLFVTAILASIKLDAIDGRRILPLGQRYHVIEPASSYLDNMMDPLQSWTLIRTDLQILLSGQVVITLSAQRTMIPMVDSENTPQRILSHASSGPGMSPVVLAPSGQIAIWRNGWIGQLEHGKASPASLSSQQLAQLEIWQHYISGWDSEQACATTDSKDIWVELLIPVQEQSELENTDSPQAKKTAIKTSMSLKSFFWPAKLCFALNVAYANSQTKVELDTHQDPVQFIIDWIGTLHDGDYGLHKSSVDADSDSDDLPVFPEDGPFDNPEAFQPFGPPTFPTSQTVYPTPPDAIMTHATPAMSAVDGLAATPSTAPRFTTDVQTEASNQGLQEANGSSADNAGSGYYDDDLFDDMPDDAFGQESSAEEPNWDFFDKPGPDQENNGDVELQNGDSMDLDTPKVPGEQDTSAPNAARHGKRPASEQVSGQEVNASQIAEPEPNSEPTPTQAEDQSSGAITHRKGSIGDSKVVPASVVLTNSRRQSVFDAVKRPAPGNRRDDRYSASGPFFFDATSQIATPKTQKPGEWFKRSPTPSTSSGDESDESDFDDIDVVLDETDAHITNDVEEDEVMQDDTSIDAAHVDLSSLRTDAKIVFDLVSIRHSRASLEETVFIGRPEALPSLNGSRVEFASELVRQLTQTPLLRLSQGLLSLQLDRTNRNEVTLSGGTLNESSTYSSITQLYNVAPAASGKPALGRVSRLVEPDIALKRLDRQITAHASILPFWDTLGMQPISMAKNVSAFCMYPHMPGMSDNCSHFLDRMSDAYTTCSLGQHSRGILENLTTDGMLEADPDEQATYPGLVAKVCEVLERKDQQGGAMVFYVIASTEDDYVAASSAAFSIRRSIAQRWANRPDQLDLVFQVIPLDFISSPNEVVVPSQSDYNDLALGIFSQLPPDRADLPPGSCDYPLVLGDGRDHVHFGLDASTIWPLSPDSVLHVAYAYSEDRRWVVAVWTDSKGNLALWIPYELKTFVLSPSRSMEDIVKDVWAVSTKLMARRRGKWRLVVARTGNYEAPEINAWMSAANAQASDGKVAGSLVLLSVELTPTLRLFPQTEQAKISQQAYGTPVSTPQGGVTSPEQMVAATPTPGGSNLLNAPTPPDHSFDANVDGDLTLIDPVEESWAVILPFGLNNMAKDILELRPAVASGYLVKRTGRKEDEGLTMLGLHMIWPTPDPAATVQGQRERELEEYLSDYRGLVTLAAARGCIDPTRSCVPWHVHTAVSGAMSLGRLI